jgi:aspartate/methionine/tyrosine aminotransferase
VPEPFFPPYQAHISLAGGKMVQVPTSFDQGFSLKAEDVEKAITPKTKVLVLNTPNNPTGALLKSEDLDQLAEIAVRHDLIVISDEVYDRIIFGGAKHDSIYTRKGMAERTLVLGSFSKAYAMTGWRLGWLFGSEDLIKGVLKVVTFNTASASTISQRGALAALRGGDAVVEKMAAEFGKRCEYVYERLRAMLGVDVHKPQGSFYIFPRIKGLPEQGLDFALELLDKKHLAVVPGDAFGPSGAGCLRLACTLKQEKLAKAMDLLEEFLHEKKI